MTVYEKMTALADAIREKTGGTEKLSIDQMTEEVAALGGGGDEVLIGLIERTATEFTVPKGCTVIGGYAFYKLSSLENIVLHDGLGSIGEYAFNECGKLAITSLPASVTRIGYRAFYGCSATSFSLKPS